MTEVGTGYATASSSSDRAVQAVAVGGRAQVSVFPGGQAPAVAVVAGELDLACADGLNSALCTAVRENAAGVEVDLAAAEFCDCSALRALVGAQQLARRLGLPFTLSHISPAVARLLEITGVSIPSAAAPA